MKYNALHQQFSFESIILQLQLLCFDFHISEIALLSCVPLKVCSCRTLGSFADCNIPSPYNVWETGSRQQHGCGVPTACASEFVVHSDFACFNTNFHYLEWESIFEYIGYVMKNTLVCCRRRCARWTLSRLKGSDLQLVLCPRDGLCQSKLLVSYVQMKKKK